MQCKNAGKKKRIITASIAGALTVAIVGTALYNDSSVSFARPSLPGVESIVNENSTQRPFKILEIVDDYSAARMGYTVAGEEPGYFDNDGVAALSDMASYAERKDRYMNGTATDPSVGSSGTGVASYNDLKGFAFEYDKTGAPFDEGSKAGDYDADTADAKNYKAYGSFVENTVTPAPTGRYDEADMSEDFKKIKIADDDDESKYNLTIEEVRTKQDGSDKSGVFYMNYIAFGTKTGTDTSRFYDIEKYTKISGSDEWKYPFKEHKYTETYTANVEQPDGTVSPVASVYNFYDTNYYAPNASFEVEDTPIVDDNGTPDDTSDDTITGHNYALSATTPVSDGDVIFINKGDTLEYYGYIAADPGDPDKLVFYDQKDGSNYMPIDGTDTDTDDSFAEIIIANYAGGTSETLCTVRDDVTEDESIDKYYISSINANSTNGRYELYTKFNPVNDPNRDIEEFGIKDESQESTPWYHVWFYKKGTIDPYVYVPAKTGKFDFVHDYTGPEVNSFYYKGGYVNYERFKKEVLDVDGDKCADICVDVITKRINEVTVEDIESADLVYFTFDKDSSAVYAGDIDKAVALAILKGITADENPLPVILNMSCYKKGVYPTRGTAGELTNADRLMSLMLLKDYASIKNYIDGDDWKASASWTNLGYVSQGFYNATFDTSHVNRSVFINDDISDTGLSDAIADDMLTEYSAAKVNGINIGVTGDTTMTNYDGFTEVQKDIDEEKFYLEVAGKDVSKFNDKITKATSIRYILNYGGRRTVGKTSIRVLDLEPFYNREIESSSNPNSYFTTPYVYNNNITYTNSVDIIVRDKFDTDWFTTYVSDTTKKDEIKVTGIGTKEFIGKIEDLNENYDLIYFGMDTAYQISKVTNVSLNGRRSIKTNEILSNDGSKYIYRHTGDTFKTNGANGLENDTYYSGGNDITPDKLRELKSYVEAGYAMILSRYFFTYDNGVDKDGRVTGINYTLVEKGSHIDEFIKWIMDEGYLYKNVDIDRNFGGVPNPVNAGSTAQGSLTKATDNKSFVDHRTNFVNYLNISKLELDVKEMPPLYNPYDTTNPNYHEYIEMNSSGQYTLDFKVELTNDAAVDTTNTTYDCKLYIDHDGDGRFEKVEALESLNITTDGGTSMYVDSDGKFNLTTGTTYYISRAVPEGYQGVLPWKLVFIENRGNNNELIKVAVQDFSAIRNTVKREPIHVLQLTSGSSDNTTLKLWNDGSANGVYTLYDNVTDFELLVDHAPVNDFITQRTGSIFENVDRYDKLCEYDMIVLGFFDGYVFNYNGLNSNSMQAILAVRKYMLSGRSVLFTHDLTSTRVFQAGGNGWGADQWGFTHNDAANGNWGYLANLYLRDIQGMDRYHWTEQYTAGLTYNGVALDDYISKYDTILPNDNNNGDTISFNGQTIRKNKDIVGLGNGVLLRKNASTLGEMGYQRDKDIESPDDRQITSVARVNRGQVTEYPFRIGDLQKVAENHYESSEIINVALTHHQYFQLNMETDYTDENYDDDIVVWYALSVGKDSANQYLKYNYNDVRNEFYIYNKGNITYTGAGHSTITGDVEKKLFVNTLVAAYNAGTHAPYAAYKSDGKTNAADITSQYLPYDISLNKSVAEGGVGNGYLDDTVTVYFKTVNNNLQDNKKPLIAQYYVEVPSGGNIVVDGKQYKIITPKTGTVKECVVENGKLIYRDVDNAQILTNGRTYKMEFYVNDLLAGESNPNNRYHAVIYTRMRAQTKGEDDATRDLNELGRNETFDHLPSSDSFKPLNINFTQLYDLK